MAAERFGLPVQWLMEAAGWQVARRSRGQAAVVCGRGNNGGDGLAAARHLHRWGRLASVCCEVDRLTGPALEQARVLSSIGVSISPEPHLRGADTIVDAILGTGLSRPVEGKLRSWIETINTAGSEVLAVDIPSGLDSDTGEALGVAVRATTTLTLGLPKTGLLVGEGPAHSGQIWIADIGIPFEVYAEMGIQVTVDLFRNQEQARLDS